VKAIHLNLASKPYRDFAPVYTVAIALAVLTALLMINNVTVAYRYLVNTRETREEIARIEAETRREQQAAGAVEAQIARTDLKGLHTQATFINSHIADRAFSWSALLDDLERVMPAGVRLTSLNPAVDPKTGLVKLSMNLRGRSHNGLVDLLEALLADTKFEQSFPQSEVRGDDGTYVFIVTTTYKPSAGMLR
jgi:type IV pilus assembly protein PilN